MAGTESSANTTIKLTGNQSPCPAGASLTAMFDFAATLDALTSSADIPITDAR
jgi:hypothetical protein